ncbi:MAG: MerR family transcriptional regulator [Sporolactobacillus sp.]
MDIKSEPTSIRDVAKKYGLSIYALRYYEKIGLFEVPRNNNGVRVFDHQALIRINSVVHYRRAGLTVKEIQMIFSTPEQDEKHLKVLSQAKENLNKQLTDLQETVKYLDYKIDYHEKRLLEKK